MILYYAPGACSLADHIALIEAGLPHSLVSVGRDKQTSDGRDFYTINAKGYTPALGLDDGSVLTENLAILVYIAETTGKLLPRTGMQRWRTLEATAFMTTELHKNFVPLFYPDTSDKERESARTNLARRFATISEQLGDNAFLIGDQMTIADAYLFVMLMWAGGNGVEVSARLQAYFLRMKVRPSVLQALTEEGMG